MKLTKTILALAVVITTGGWGAARAAAQNPDAIDNARSLAKSLQQKQANDSNAALNVAGVPTTAKPAPAQAAAKQASPQPSASQSPSQSKTAPAPQAAKSAAAPAPAKAAAPSNAAKGGTAKSPAQSAMAGKKPGKGAKTTIAAKPQASGKPADGTAKKTEDANAAKPGEQKPGDKDVKKDDKKEDKKWAMSGKRDPFFSPVVQQTGPACSTGKKCLEINAINLRGVVKSDSGFIAVVTNSLGKAYFLRENDPVFNGFVVRITGDSVVFEETVEDKLGKPFTREVVKRIFTPAV